ncbi:MAG: peptidase M14 family protein [bacterium]|nr:peptidase M14 family protein [bacterium]
MRSHNIFIKVLCLIFIFCLAASVHAVQIQSPETYFGHKPGADYKMIRWDKMVPYFNTLGEKSSRIKVEELGETTLGNPFILATISSPDNIANLERYKEISKKLAQGKISEEEADLLARQGKTVALITCSMHANECGPTQMSPELAYFLATDDSPETRRILDDVIILLVPSWNPDGNILETDWYRQNLGTPYEGSSMPWLYHHYVGHDNNRDGFMHTQIETKYVTDILYHDWFPQIFMDMHHFGNRDARLFLSPLYEPRHHSLDPLLTREIELTGAYMRTLLEEKGKTAVMHYAKWNHWRMSAIHTSALWHNISTILFEAASARLATPIFQEESDFTKKREPRLGQNGNEQTINYPSPWKGGWWRLRDIVEYSYWSCIGFLEAGAQHKERYLRNMYTMARNSIEKGQNEAPYAFIIPQNQRDPNRVAKMVNILIDNGVEIHQLNSSIKAGDSEYLPGDYVVLSSQAYRPFIIDILGPQIYPDRHLYPGGPPESTFDITGWTLPYQMGVDVVEVENPVTADLSLVIEAEFPEGKVVGNGRKYLIDHNVIDSYRAVNKLLKDGHTIGWAADAFKSGSKQYPGGTIVVEGRRDSDVIEDVAKEYHLEIYAGEPDKEIQKLKPLKLGLYQPWTASMDEGWTRWIFDNWEFPYTTLHNADIQKSDLKSAYDVIVLPNISSRSIMNGRSKESVPEKYSGGIAEAGVEALREFVNMGGTLIALNSSCQFLIDKFQLPIKDVSGEYKSSEFFCPSSILQVELNTDHPIAYGMNRNVDILSFNSPLLEMLNAEEISKDSNILPLSNMKVIGRYPNRNPFRSGRLIGEHILRNKPVLVEAEYGKGKLVLFAFRPQNRAQTHGTFMLFFNSLYYGQTETESR